MATSESDAPETDAPETDARERTHDPAGAHDAGKASDFLANERTLLAWIRTCVALVALGFVVARFGLLLRELAQRAGVASGGARLPYASSLFGSAIVLLAGALIVLSFLRYRRTATGLARGKYQESQVLTAALAVVSFAVALLLAIYLLVS